ncbi:metal-sensitive transcriptional regulator [Salsipaludibacter albus]|uniref:metal-sensitive transcriptional regulator n=1 Tax=Salsipaludibacter albus TaxID=2849650 RepID=UPI001EE49DCA|nr:metal-sensitive transcriptional regulator [Salsipaludibacter albus]MBY5160884.1 metal-sensitive transcriptional regulator [Salsipaludibacter albus]
MTTSTTPPTEHRSDEDSHHHPPGYLGDKAKVLARLRRVEGQVRGLQRMVDEDTYCIDVLTQVSAATKALENVALLLLDDHVRHCVADDVRSGSTEKVDEAMQAITRLVKS